MMIQAIEAGADGAMPKNASHNELLKAVEVVCEGGEYFGHEVTKAMLQKYRARNSASSPKSSTLTARELEVLKLFAQSKSYKEIASELSISTHTVESHKNNILKKLKLKTVVDLAKYALREGFVDE